MLSPLWTIGFIPLVFFVWVALAALVARYAKAAWVLIPISAIWLAFTGTLAALGFFRNFTALPPRLPIFVGLELLFLVYVIFFSPWRNYLTRIPRRLVVAMQCFRVPVEILLSGLAMHHILPMEMSYHGRNFDILTGLTALPLAIWLAGHPSGGRWLLRIWNVLGIGLVTNVFVHGLLSAPTPFQQLHFSVDNFVIGYFPVVWLPLFLVPTAYGLHLLSLRQGGQHA